MNRKFAAAVTVAALASAATVGAVLLRSDAEGLPGYSDKAISDQLALMQASSGHIVPPARAVGLSLENTAFAASMAGDLENEWPQVSKTRLDAALQESSISPIWDAYYLATVRGGNVEPSAGWSKYQRPDGTFVEGDTKDVPVTVMSTWAALQAGAPRSRKLSETVGSIVRGCAQNEYVTNFAARIMAEHGSVGEVERVKKSVRDCLAKKSTLAKPVDYPKNEEDLLGLVGRALSFDFVGWPSPDLASKYVSVLRPRDWFWTDPWWASQSWSGFRAAGGSPQEYRGTVSRWRDQAVDGVMPTLSSSQPTIQLDLLASLIGTNTGEGWSSVSARAVMSWRDSPSASQWQDSDYAIWGLLAYTARVALDRRDQTKVAASADACLKERPSPANLRTLWLCHTAARAFGSGASFSVLGSDEAAALPTATLVETAALGGLEPTITTVKKAVEAVLQSPEGYRTEVIAQALILASEQPGSADDRMAEQTLTDRHAEGSALYRSTPEDSAIDMWATYWVSVAGNVQSRQ